MADHQFYLQAAIRTAVSSDFSFYSPRLNSIPTVVFGCRSASELEIDYASAATAVGESGAL